MEIKKGFTVKSETPHGTILASKIDEGNQQGIKISLEAPCLDKPVTLTVVEYNADLDQLLMHFREDTQSKSGKKVCFQNYLSCVAPDETVYVSLMGNRKLLGKVTKVEKSDDFLIEDLSGELFEVKRFDIVGIRKVYPVEDWINNDGEVIISFGSAASALCGHIRKKPAENEEKIIFHTVSGQDFKPRISDIKAVYTYQKGETNS